MLKTVTHDDHVSQDDAGSGHAQRDVAANVCTKSSSFWVASTAPSVLKTRGAQQMSALASRAVSVKNFSSSIHSGFSPAKWLAQPFRKACPLMASRAR